MIEPSRSAKRSRIIQPLIPLGPPSRAGRLLSLPVDVAEDPIADGAGADLALAARLWCEGSIPAEQLHRTFLRATVFLQAGDRPGLRAFGDPPSGLVLVWTSEGALARSLGPSAWFSTTGADLFSLVPTGFDLLVDPDGPAPVHLRPSALGRVAAVTVGWA